MNTIIIYNLYGFNGYIITYLIINYNRIIITYNL